MNRLVDGKSGCRAMVLQGWVQPVAAIADCGGAQLAGQHRDFRVHTASRGPGEVTRRVYPGALCRGGRVGGWGPAHRSAAPGPPPPSPTPASSSRPAPGRTAPRCAESASGQARRAALREPVLSATCRGRAPSPSRPQHPIPLPDCRRGGAVQAGMPAYGPSVRALRTYVRTYSRPCHGITPCAQGQQSGKQVRAGAWQGGRPVPPPWPSRCRRMR